MKKSMTNKGRIVASAALALVMGAGFVAGTNINASAATEPVFGNYFTSDYDTRDEVLDAASELNEEIYGEGVVMLKNEGNSLPLADGANISVFGKNSANVLTGGSGAGSGGGGATVSLTDALNNAGFNLNPTLVNFYRDNALSGSGRGTAPTNGNVTPGYNTGETPLSMYTDEMESTYDTYGDAAIVVISRISGEGFDLPRTMKWNGSSYGTWGTDATQLVPGARSVDDHYLQLDQNETDLIKYCGDRFDKVIVLLNCGSQFETGFLDDPGHYAYHENTKAALWIGYPGSNGLNALADILKGEINPSGRTMDTFARDFKTDPVWYNFSNNMMEGNPSLKGNQYENLAASGGNGGGGYVSNYVTYKEGIYMGYRYWETRGYDEGTGEWTVSSDDTDHANYLYGTTTTQWDNWYDGHVVYPLGHGLSYTTFSQEIVSADPADGSALAKDGTITIQVKVTNTGSVAGKEVVQLYYTAPYIEGEVEKAHVVLAAFDKTKLLQPQESETLTLSFKVREMASYDWSDANKNGSAVYEMDEGAYTVRLMRDAHNEIDSVDYTAEEDFIYDTDSSTGNPVENRFDQISEYIPSYDKYMTRGDWSGTFPTTDYKLTAEEWIIEGLHEWDRNGEYARTPEDDESEPWYTTDMPATGEDNGIMLTDLVGLEYDDPMWEDFLDQLTYDQLVRLACDGNYNSGQNWADLGITRVPNADGPAGFIYGAPSGTYSFWCCDTVLASTYNTDLAYEKGRAMGNEALWGNGSNNSRIGGWYAPAVNIHRSPFSGRNFEYYSEDGYLSGMMSAYVVRGAQDKGLFCYVKHFGVNDQETNRCGLMTWASEQAMREIYLRPFELCVKVGETMGIMSSLNRIGYTWAGGDYRLLTELLRDEWGFEGCVVTDSYMGDTSGLSNIDQLIRAGGNLALGNAHLYYEPESATAVTALRNAAHGLLYAHANSMAMNTAVHPVTPKPLESFTGGALRRGVTNSSYSDTVATAVISDELYPDADESEIVYSLAEDSALPAGLYLSPDGTVSGTPSEELNNYIFTIKATFKDYSLTADFNISIVNEGGSIVYEQNQDLGSVIIGEACEVSVAGASIFVPNATPEDIERLPAVNYSLADGSLLPEGLTLTSDGRITGTPSKECENYKFTVVASALGYKDVSLEFTLDVFNDITFTGNALAAGKVGVSYVQRVTPAQTANDVTYTLKAGSTLPAGLSLTADGYITGTPTATVTDHAFTVVAHSAFASDAEAEYTITIGLAFNDVTLPDGQEGVEYSALINMAQGATDITYSLKSGSTLPEGLTLSAGGELSGTPAKAGVYELTFVASAEGKASDEITVTLYIANAESTGCSAAMGGTDLVIAGASLLAAAAVVTGFSLARRKREDRRED